MPRTPLIFDIDGTLLDSEHLDAKYFVRAVRDVAGDIHIADNWSTYTKVTDVGIISEILIRNGITDIDEYIVAIRKRFGELLDGYFSRGGTCASKPGAREFFNLVKTHPEYAVGIATGGWSHSARMKLTVAGIDTTSIPMSTSDNGDERETIMQHCLDAFDGPLTTPVYFGDGVWDSAASKHLGWRFIGIGSKLHGKTPHWFSDFSNPKSLLRIINVT